MKFSGLRFTNGLLLALVILLTLSGVYGLFWTRSEWMFALHRASGWGLLALLPWKGMIVLRSLQRRLRGREAGQFDPGWITAALVLSVLTVAILALGLLWKGHFGPQAYPLRQTAISWHWMLALALLLPFGLHVWRRWPRPRRVDFLSRRAFLRAALVVPAAGLGYLLYARGAGARQKPQEAVRYSGSRRAGWYSGNDFPLTHNQAPDAGQIDVKNWSLVVARSQQDKLRLDYEHLAQLPTDAYDATLDCTLGWYARQTWRGVRLEDLLALAGIERPPAWVRLTAVTGYSHALPWSEARQVLLATHVGDEVLSAGHGFPLRAVVPSRRGWFWVKWVTRIETD